MGAVSSRATWATTCDAVEVLEEQRRVHERLMRDFCLGTRTRRSRRRRNFRTPQSPRAIEGRNAAAHQFPVKSVSRATCLREEPLVVAAERGQLGN